MEVPKGCKVCLIFKLKTLCLICKRDANATLRRADLRHFQSTFPADYRPKDSLETAIEQMKK